MDILVIGNGFDLAHNLPTRYTDFLEFCKVIKKLYCIDDYWCNIDLRKMCSEINIALSSNASNMFKQWIVKMYKKRRICDQKYIGTKRIEIEKKIDEFEQCINYNFWIDYFSGINAGEDWTDFENEISNVIISLDNDMQNKGNRLELDDYVENLSNDFLKCMYIDKVKEQKTYRTIRKNLLDDLYRLTRALEIYLMEFVGDIRVTKKMKDIEEINPHCVLSFNYTDTYERVYGVGNNIKFDYVYGSIIKDDGKKGNNMVLGINEYLPPDRKNSNTEFIAFKKFYQRIQKETGSKYKSWIDTIRKSGQEIETVYRKRYPMQIPYSNYRDGHRVYIFGHSLDVTDKDILIDLILNDNVYTTIFYRNKKQFGKQIINLVKIVGQNELIRRTGGSTKTIEFKLQQDMVEKV